MGTDCSNCCTTKDEKMNELNDLGDGRFSIQKNQRPAGRYGGPSQNQMEIDEAAMGVGAGGGAAGASYMSFGKEETNNNTFYRNQMNTTADDSEYYVSFVLFIYFQKEGYFSGGRFIYSPWNLLEIRPLFFLVNSNKYLLFQI